MLAVAFLLLAFTATFAATLRSLGWGFATLLACGYFNGYIRANYLSVFTTFLFDAGVLGLYLGFLTGYGRQVDRAFTGPAGQWVLALILWPTFIALLPVNDFLVQLVALRATVWFLPCLLIATRLRATDLDVLTRGLAVLNFVALVGGVYVYQYGVESLYPYNAVTEIIYRSNDVAGYRYHRIPSFFLSAHAYGGTMLLTLPFLVDRLFGRGVGWPDRLLAAGGTAAALLGILMCASRQPVILLVGSILVGWVAARFHLVFGVTALGVLLTGVGVAATNPRLQRFADVQDTEFISHRVQLSVNETFLELMATYPAGAGMGSSFGTSIPYFLADRAPKQIGLENEFSRILIDQGLIGLGLWLGFLLWLLMWPPPARFDRAWGLGVVLMYALVVTNWATAFIGAGTLSSVPGSVLLLLQMGVLCRVRDIQTGTAG